MLYLEHKIISFFETHIDLNVNSNIRLELIRYLLFCLPSYLLILGLVFIFREQIILALISSLVSVITIFLENMMSSVTRRHHEFIGSFVSVIYPFFYLVHVVLPRTRDRESEVIAFNQAQNQQEQNSLQLLKELKEEVSAPNQLLEKYINLIKLNLPLFVKDNFKYSKALVRYISENIKNEEGEINEYLLFFILLIPHRKTMEFDCIRAIIQSALQHQQQFKIFVRHSLIEYIENPDLVSEKFKLYSPDKIKSLLTKTYNPDEFCRFISIVMLGEELSMDSKTISSIIKTKPKKVFNDDLFVLESKSAIFEFRVLTNYLQYEITKKDFRNCIISYFERDYDIVTCYKDKEPLACISIKDKRIIEIKAPNNKEVEISFKKEIIDLVEETLSQ